MKRNWHHIGTLVIVAALLGAGLAAPGVARAQGGQQAFLGVRVRSTADGALIQEVIPETGAAAAGLQVGNLITAVDGEPVNRTHDLAERILAHQPGDTVTLTVQREGEEIEVEVTLGTAPEEVGPEGGATVTVTTHYVCAGATFAVVEGGGEVLNVRAGTIAADAGLEVGDLVVTLNGDPVVDLSLSQVASTVTTGGEITLGVRRNGEELEITAELPAGTPIQTFEVHEAQAAPVPVEPVEPPVVVPSVPGLVPGGVTEPRGYLGVSYATLTADNRADLEADLSLDIPVVEGGLVVEVLPDTPAAASGLAVGDVITAVDGDVVDVEHTLADRIYAYEPGDTVELTVVRGAETLTLEATLAERPASAEETIIRLPFPVDLEALRAWAAEHPDLMSELQDRLEQYFQDGDPGPLRAFLEEHGIEVPELMTPFQGTPFQGTPFQGRSGRSGVFSGFDMGRFLQEHPQLNGLLERFREDAGRQQGRGGFFLNPNFDWESFLAEHPAFSRWLEEIFPGFPWFNRAEPAPRDVEPGAPAEGVSSAPA